MNLPSKFKWLLEIGPLPKMVTLALTYLGTSEISGDKDNQVIMGMAKELGLEKIYTSDDKISWCALFVNYIIKMTGKPMVDPKGNLWNYLRALWMINWGKAVTIDNMMLGDVVVFKREGGGHVGLVIAESKNTVFVLGGNQSNSVTITEIAKNRIAGVRRFYATAPPASVKKYVLDSTGKLSTNEA